MDEHYDDAGLTVGRYIFFFCKDCGFWLRFGTFRWAGGNENHYIVVESFMKSHATFLFKFFLNDICNIKFIKKILVKAQARWYIKKLNTYKS